MHDVPRKRRVGSWHPAEIGAPSRPRVAASGEVRLPGAVARSPAERIDVASRAASPGEGKGKRTMSWIKRLSATVGSDRGLRSAARRRARPWLEGLEKREVLYSASGNAWPAAQLVTISFAPDGTNIGGKTSDLQARFNSMFGSASTW